MKKKRKLKKTKTKPTVQQLISKYSIHQLTLTLPTRYQPQVPTTPLPTSIVQNCSLSNAVEENQSKSTEKPNEEGLDQTNSSKLRVKSAKELGVSNHNYENTELPVTANSRQEKLDLANKNGLERLMAVYEYYFTKEKISLKDLVTLLRTAIIELCEKKIIKVYSTEEFNNADYSELQELSKTFVNTFSNALLKVDESHKRLFTMVVYSVLTKNVETNKISVEIIQIVLKKLLKLESYSDEITASTLFDTDFVTKINLLKNIFEYNIETEKLEDCISFKSDEYLKLEEDEEDLQETETVSTSCFF